MKRSIHQAIAGFSQAGIRWQGMIGGGVGGIAATMVYAITGDKVSALMGAGMTALFCLGGFMLGLFFEHYNPDYYGNVRSIRFIGSCTLAGALVVAVLGAFASKVLTDDCFAAVRMGKSYVENCRMFVGTAVLASGSEILAVSVSAGCFCVQMRRSRRPWIKALLTSTLIAAFIACGIIVLFGMLDVGDRYFNIERYPAVNPRTVLVGGAILGGAMGLLVGLHAALMIAFAPETSRPTAIPPDGGTPADFDVFLSHNSNDKAFVRQLADALQVRGIKVWLDERELIPGHPWQEGVEQIIQNVRSAAILIGSHGLGAWETPEMRGCLSEFVRRKLPVIPVLLPEAPAHLEMPLFLREFTRVDLRGGLTKDGLDRLIWGITKKKP